MIRDHVTHAVRPPYLLHSWQIVSLTPCTTHAEAEQAIQDLVEKLDPFQTPIAQGWADPDWDWD